MNELSSHGGCMELNLEQIERYCGNQKPFNLVENSRRRWGFSFHFRFFCWFQELQPTSDSGRSGLFKMLVWDEFWKHSSAWISSRQIPTCTSAHGDIQVFLWISPILLILRISTGQRFRKERSVHEACMGWIMEGIERLNSIKTDSESDKNSWRYSGFSFPFCWFCLFWAFQPASASGRSSLFMKLVWDEY